MTMLRRAPHLRRTHESRRARTAAAQLHQRRLCERATEIARLPVGSRRFRCWLRSQETTQITAGCTSRCPGVPAAGAVSWRPARGAKLLDRRLGGQTAAQSGSGLRHLRDQVLLDQPTGNRSAARTRRRGYTGRTQAAQESDAVFARRRRSAAAFGFSRRLAKPTRSKATRRSRRAQDDDAVFRLQRLQSLYAQVRASGPEGSSASR